MIEKFLRIHYFLDYISQKEREVAEYKAKYEIDGNNRVNGRSLTNIDIFDHLFAVAPEFGLRVFQNPTGTDLRNLVDKSRNKALVGERSYSVLI